MSSHNSHPSSERVPAALVNRSRRDWQMFTKAIVVNCLAVAGLLLFMLLVFKIL